MGTVYAVTHEEIGKRAALKVMHDFLATGVTAERIKLEARVVNRVGHPNIVDIFETGSLDDGRPYIVMERLDGTSLGALAYEARLMPDRAVDFLIQICDALIAAHAAGVIHRDLKLDNVFVLQPDETGVEKVKLLDWGIAKEVTSDARHTVDGQLVGTPQYLSPEQARGAELTPATDIYSLGVMAFELFLEQLPFEAETAAEIMVMHLREEPPVPSELWPDIPKALEVLLLAMLAKKPEDRPSLETIAATLLHVKAELDSRRAEPKVVIPRHTRFASAPPLAMPAKPHKKHWQVALGACALAASAVLFIIARGSSSLAAPAPAAIAEPEQKLEVQPIEAPAPTVQHEAVPAPAPAPAPVVTEARVSAPPISAKPDPARGLPSTKKRATHHVGGPATHQHQAASFDPDGSVAAY